jgi:type I restriction enzyme R subunit
VFSSNGDGFLFHDRSATDSSIETELTLDAFPAPDDLWNRFKIFKGIQTEEQERIISQEYYSDGSGRKPRYYQEVAINRTIEAIAKGQNRMLLVMATGTGKTYTAFQIVYSFMESKGQKANSLSR